MFIQTSQPDISKKPELVVRMVRGGLAIRQQRNNNNTKCWVPLGPTGSRPAGSHVPVLRRPLEVWAPAQLSHTTLNSHRQRLIQSFTSSRQSLISPAPPLDSQLALCSVLMQHFKVSREQSLLSIVIGMIFLNSKE